MILDHILEESKYYAVLCVSIKKYASKKKKKETII